MRDLPDIFCDSHDVYSRRHVDFVRSLYNEWADPGFKSGPPPLDLDKHLERYVRELLEEREVKVKVLNAVEKQPPDHEQSTTVTT